MSEPIPDDIHATAIVLCHQWLAMREAGHAAEGVAEAISGAIPAERRRWTDGHPSEAFRSSTEPAKAALLRAVSSATVTPFKAGRSMIDVTETGVDQIDATGRLPLSTREAA